MENDHLTCIVNRLLTCLPKQGYVNGRVLHCIGYRYLYSTSHGVSQAEVLSVHFNSKKKVRLKARDGRVKGIIAVASKGGGGPPRVTPAQWVTPRGKNFSTL